jgi:hypothetical protein
VSALARVALGGAVAFWSDPLGAGGWLAVGASTGCRLSRRLAPVRALPECQATVAWRFLNCTAVQTTRP